MNYELLYATTLVVSFLLTLIFLLCHSRYWNPATHIPLLIIYLLNMSSSLLCIVWVFVDGKPQWSPVNYIANIIEFNCLGYSGYCWFRYCTKFVDFPSLKTRTAAILTAMPVGFVTILILTTPLTHWLFYIDRDGFFHRGSHYFFQFTAYAYLAAASVICLVGRRKSATSYERNRLTVLALFTLPPTLFGSIQIFMPSGAAPTLQFSVSLSLILVFINELDQKITRDSLTQLRNRYEFERILQNKMREYPKLGKQLYVLVCDLDDFKKINDHYGHHQGDIALSMVGQVLTRVADSRNSICARMSGDEFVSLIEADSSEVIQAYQTELNQALLDACSDLPYSLKLSIGAAVYNGSESLMQLLNQADQKMYAQKQAHKQILSSHRGSSEKL